MLSTNILLFRGENKTKMRETLRAWRDKFIQKHGEINLLELNRENISDDILSDIQAPGFMGASRMIIMHDLLSKTTREINEIEEQEAMEKAGEAIDFDEKVSTKKFQNDEYWITNLAKIPAENFVLFLGNTKPVGQLEKWLQENATIHDFGNPSPREMQGYVMDKLGITANQAELFCAQLGYYEEFKFGKNIVVGKPDFIYQEVAKFQLLNKKGFTNDELGSVLPDYRDENAFNLLDPLWDRNAGEMIQIWQRLMATADHELTTAMTITMIRKILISATFERLGDLPITSGQRNTGKRLASGQKRLKKLYDDVIEVDIAQKSGELPHKTNAFLMALLSYASV